MSDHHDAPPADPRLVDAARAGCAESRLLISRRAVMGISASLFSWAFMPRAAMAGVATDPRLLVVFLRGGVDGINVCVPHGDPAYVGQRGKLALPKTSTIPLTSFFGLNPALKSFGAMYKAGEASIVHAVAPPRRNRSHFDCSDNVENGYPDMPVGNQTGWLNRLLQALPVGNRVKALGAIQVGEAPLILHGAAPVLGWSPTWFWHPEAAFDANLAKLYAAADPELGSFLARGLQANALATQVVPGDDNVSQLQKAFRGAGRLMGAATGPRIAVLSVNNFDTHSDQGVLDGALADSLGELDLGLSDFKTAIGSAWSQTVVVCVTEFGRTVMVNGDSGTDHGLGTVTLLAGGAVAGGKVVANWPGLATANLVESRDLRPTTDLRSVFKGVLIDHLGVPPTIVSGSVFPSSTAAPPLGGLVKAAAKTRAAPGDEAGEPIDTTPAIARYRARFAA